ncbi:hypothetical protein EVJ58_g2736 [Rhodofomes roseus]|uniref:Uncharacterized protein n=1 Tax=Rhodofomes roseus TaxID=34475 RepID=A0A4Y9YR31_9APHY|nr:hypothetical protein EVJ58_g2736 [Rhodofomes roseus]
MSALTREASYAMLAYLDRTSPTLDGHDVITLDPTPFTETITLSGSTSEDDPLTILELGSGTGLVAARIGAYLQHERDIMVATDLPDVCPLLQKNLQDCATVEVHPLSWGSHQDALSIASSLALGSARRLAHVICSDLVYFPALLAPLLRTLLHLTSEPIVAHSQPSPRIIVSYKIRSLAKETSFWGAFGLWFTFAPVLARRRASGDGERNEGRWDRFIPVPGQDETFVFIGHRRPESRIWSIPEDDEGLLGGVGAWGTMDHKVDDTFETMLLMSLGTMDE